MFSGPTSIAGGVVAALLAGAPLHPTTVTSANDNTAVVRVVNPRRVALFFPFMAECSLSFRRRRLSVRAA